MLENRMAEWIAQNGTMIIEIIGAVLAVSVSILTLICIGKKWIAVVLSTLLLGLYICGVIYIHNLSNESGKEKGFIIPVLGFQVDFNMNKVDILDNVSVYNYQIEQIYGNEDVSNIYIDGEWLGRSGTILLSCDKEGKLKYIKWCYFADNASGEKSEIGISMLEDVKKYFDMCFGDAYVLENGAYIWHNEEIYNVAAFLKENNCFVIWEPYEEIKADENKVLISGEVLYNNSIIIEPICVSVYAENIQGKDVPISYSRIDLDDVEIVLYNSERNYILKREGHTLLCENIVPGEYSIQINGPIKYDIEKSSIKISNGESTRDELHLELYDKSKYETFSSSYEKMKNSIIEFLDDDGKTIADGYQFKLDDRGTLFLKVAWELEEHDVRFRTPDNKGKSVVVERQYNGANWIN